MGTAHLLNNGWWAMPTLRDYSSDAERECNAFHKRTGRIIKLLTVQEILDEEFLQKM